MVSFSMQKRANYQSGTENTEAEAPLVMEEAPALDTDSLPAAPDFGDME